MIFGKEACTYEFPFINIEIIVKSNFTPEGENDCPYDAAITVEGCSLIVCMYVLFFFYFPV